MNKLNEKNAHLKERKTLFQGKRKDWIIFGIIALVLLLAVYFVFQDKESKSVMTATEYTQTETEWKIQRLLEEIDGVGDAEVVVCETEAGVQSVVVVCEGARDLQVIMTIREAVASAVGTQEKSVKIYLKK